VRRWEHPAFFVKGCYTSTRSFFGQLLPVDLNVSTSARDSFVPRGLLTTRIPREVDISDGPCGHVTEGSDVLCAVTVLVF
jgi:hypothetical protein